MTEDGRLTSMDDMKERLAWQVRQRLRHGMSDTSSSVFEESQRDEAIALEAQKLINFYIDPHL